MPTPYTSRRIRVSRLHRSAALLPESATGPQQHKFINLVGKDNARIRKTRVIQHLGGTNAQVRQVARIQANVPTADDLLPQFFKTLIALGNAAFQRVNRIHQQNAVVGVNLAYARNAPVPFTQRHEHLDHAVGVGSFGRILPARAKSPHSRCEVRSSDQPFPCACTLAALPCACRSPNSSTN